VGKVQGTPECSNNNSQLLMLYGHLVHVGKTLTDLEILVCELHKNAFGNRALPGPAGGAIALPRLSSHYKGEGKGKERVGNSRERT